MLNNNLINIATIISNLFIVIIILILINKYFNYKKENISSAIRKSSFLMAFSIAILSTFLTNGEDVSWIMNSVGFIVDVSIIISLLTVSLIINDKFLLPNINNTKEIHNNNIAVGIVESATTLATGFILFSSMYGLGSYLSGFIFFILGQLSLFLMLYIYKKVSKLDILGLIENNNKSMAATLFSIIIGFSIIVSVNIYGDSFDTNLLAEIKYFFYVLIVYIIFLFVFLNNFLDKIFFTSFIVKDEIINDNLKKIIPYSIVKLCIIILIAFIVNSNL